MRRLAGWLVPAVVAVTCAAAAAPIGASDQPRTVVVTTSMLESAVNELVGDDGVRVVRLMPPGTCPGHFDLKPSVLPTLRDAVVLIRHDYQPQVEAALSRAGAAGVEIVTAPTPGSLLLPANYLTLLEEVGAILDTVLPDRAAATAARIEDARRRLERLAADLRERAGPWRGRPVLASAMQAQFCRWLGLEVAGEIERAEDLTPRELADLLALSPAAVVANLQEGTRAATVLGERLNRPVVVLSNFPSAPGFGDNYDELVRANVDRLAAVWPDA